MELHCKRPCWIGGIFSSKETAIESQYDVKKLKFSDIELENNPEHLDIWSNHLDCYLSTLLEDGLTINTEVPLKNMSEKECDRCLSTQSYSKLNNVSICPNQSYVGTSQSTRKTDTLIMPLILENNSTLACSCAILDQFAEEFSIPTTSYSDNLPFDTSHMTLSIKQAYEHVEFIAMMGHHTKEKQQQNDLLENAERNEDNMDGKVIGDEDFDDDDDGVTPHTEQQ